MMKVLCLSSVHRGGRARPHPVPLQPALLQDAAQVSLECKVYLRIQCFSSVVVFIDISAPVLRLRQDLESPSGHLLQLKNGTYVCRQVRHVLTQDTFK